MSKRIFRVEGGELAEKIKAITQKRELIGHQYEHLNDVFGSDSVHTWPWTGRFAGCSFAAGKEPGLIDWRLTHQMWVPRKKTLKGAELWEMINALDPLPAIQTVLEDYGLTVHKNQIEIDRTGPSFVEGFGHVGIYFVTVPWVELAPEFLEIVDSLGETTKDVKFIRSWVTPNDWVEISETQKIIEWSALDRE